MSQVLDTQQQQHIRLVFPLLGDNNFGPWRQRMSDQLKEMDLWWIVSGREVAPRSDSTEPADVQAYDKWLRKCFRITAKIRNAMEPHICAQYVSDTYDMYPKAVWDKLAEGYREALGLELYYIRRSLFECTLEAHGTVTRYVHEIDRIIECLREVEEIIKGREKTFYLLNGLLATWREWRDLQATIIKPNQPDELVAAIKAREASLNRNQGISGDTVLAIGGRKSAGSASGKSTRRTEPTQAERRDRSTADETLTCYYCQKKGASAQRVQKAKIRS